MIEKIATEQYNELTRFEHPWPFYVVDNFLDNNTLRELIYLSKQQDQLKFVDCWNGTEAITIPDSKLPTKRSLQLSQYNNLFDSIRMSINKHIAELLPEKHFIIPDLIVCDPGYCYGPHKDHPDKKMSIVIFIHPTMSDATILRHDETNYRLQWRVNRALIFKQEEHGIHHYINNTQYPRVTLNVYITTDSPIPFQVSNFTPA